MIRKYLFRLTFMFLLISTGCVSETGMIEGNWGKAYETAKYEQRLNPDADKNLTSVEGLDGEAAKNNMESYRKSFEKSKESAIYNINLTGIGGK